MCMKKTLLKRLAMHHRQAGIVYNEFTCARLEGGGGGDGTRKVKLPVACIQRQQSQAQCEEVS
jgi:hypothetical protein